MCVWYVMCTMIVCIYFVTCFVQYVVFFVVFSSIQEGQLSVSGERMCTILVNCLED